MNTGAKKASSIEIFCWCLFDFANSSYATIILTAVFPAFFVSYISEMPSQGVFIWGIVIAASNLIVVLLSPFLGALSDYNASKKKYLAIFSIGCVFTTSLLFFSYKSGILYASIFVLISSVFFFLSENFISSFLPEISSPENMGKISGYAWSLGYVGGIASLILSLLVIKEYGGVEGSKISMVLTSAFFLIFSIPAILVLKERSAKKEKSSKGSIWLLALRENLKTFREAKKNKNLFIFLVSFFFFSAGIIVVITFSSIFAKSEFGFKTKELLVIIIAVNIFASLGAFLFGFIQDRIGAKKTIIINLVIWCAVIAAVYFVKKRSIFFILSFFIGICLGSTQSSSRAVIGLLTKEGRFGEDFGLWGFFGKLASIVGSFLYGFLVFLLNSNRRALLGVLLFFLIGLFVLFFVKIPDIKKENS